MIINKLWAMPNKNTFKIKAFNNIIDKYNNNNLFSYKKDFISIDPFANENKLATVSYTHLTLPTKRIV